MFFINGNLSRVFFFSIFFFCEFDDSDEKFNRGKQLHVDFIMEFTIIIIIIDA